MISSFRSNNVNTVPVSIRLDGDLLSYIRENHLNLSATVNRLLRSYLYIHSVDNTIEFSRLNSRVPGIDIHVDIYSDISDNLFYLSKM